MPDHSEPDVLPDDAGGDYVLPASFAQRRLWMLHQLDPSSAAYNMPLALWLDGALDHAPLLAALQRIAERHETLRTRFGLEAGEPVQLVADTPHVAISRHQAGTDAEALLLAQRSSAEPFDLATGPLWRIALIAVRADRHLLLINLHHAICDGWSIAVLMDELCRLYADPDAVLPPLPLQYADYAAWQAAQLSGPTGDALIERCRHRLDGAPQQLDLPTDHPRSAARSAGSGSVHFAMPPATAARLRALALAHDATPMMLHAAIFAALLGRWCDQAHVVLGVPVAGRDRFETERTIGLFVNVVLLPCDLRGAPSLRTVLHRTREVMLAALADQALPFDRLVEAVQPVRNLRQNPLFQVLFSYQNLPPAHADFAGLHATAADLRPATPQFDLSVSLAEEDGTAAVRLDYDAALFESDTIERLAQHWQRLAEAAATDPDRPLGALPLLTAAEAARQIAGTAPLPTPIPDWCVHTAIIAAARRHPQRLFVSATNGKLTGAALADAIEATAQRLAACGIGRGDRVGVYLNRGAHLVSGLLGVLASGAAYVPLDPLYPRERIRQVLAQAGARAVLTEQTLAADLAGQTLVVLDQAGPTAPVTTHVGPNDLAYVIFTSGSTGAPKGVAIPHRALTNLLAALAEKPGCGPDDVWLATTTVSFDIAMLELFLPLLTGARLVIADAATVSDGEALGQALETHGATIMQATPSGWRLWLASGWQGRGGLRALSGGEALPADLAQALAQTHAELWNLYGPTETTIWSAAGPVAPVRSGTVPIGAPIANTRIYVLDHHLHLVPIGMIGEICIAGDGVGWGYFGRPGLTAERFIADPYGPPGSRLYRTGDLGRRRRDGTIEFLGRNDHQVKLRGYRIEPDEIAAALRVIDGVADAVVALVGAEENAELVAWVAPGAASLHAPLDAAMLRTVLAGRLPRYMIPAQFVVLSAFPLTPNGKLDRNRLPPPGLAGPTAATAPRDASEAAMLDVWQDVLGRTGFGVDDDFFALGGHSLLAIRLIAAVCERFGKRVGVRDLFLHPTVAGLAAALAAPQQALVSPLIPLATGGEGLPLLIVPGAGGTPVYLRALASSLADRHPVWGFEAIGADGLREPIESVEAMAAAYLAAARTRQLGPPWLLAGHSFGSRIAYEMARQAEAADEIVRGLVIFDTVAPILDTAPFAGVAGDENRVMQEVLAALAAVTNGHPATEAVAFAALPAAGRINRISEQLLSLGGRSGETAARGLCNVYRAALRAHYRAPGSITAPVMLLKAATQAAMPGDAPVPELEALRQRPLWGWEQLLPPARITTVTVEGDHITLLSPPFVGPVAARLRPWLAARQRDGPK